MRLKKLQQQFLQEHQPWLRGMTGGLPILNQNKQNLEFFMNLRANKKDKNLFNTFFFWSEVEIWGLEAVNIRDF